MAMTEFRVRDVGGVDTPLIGLPGRIGTFPDQGSHPGPLGYYLLAPVYRLLGSSAIGLLVGAVLVAAASAVACVLVIRRMGGLRLQWAVVVVLLAVVQTYGFDLVGQPWNPYLPLLPWLATMIAVWAVVVGDNGVLWVATLAGTLCAQTHLPYVGLAGSVVVGATLVVAWRWWRCERGSEVRARTGRSLAIGVGVGVVCWIPVAVDQLFGSQNLSMIIDYFRDPPEEAIGKRAGLDLLLRHLDVTRFAELSRVGLRHLRSGGHPGPAVAASRRHLDDRVGSCRRRCRAGGARPAVGGAARFARSVCGARCVLDGSHLRQGLVLPHTVGLVDHGAHRRSRGLDCGRSDRSPAGRSTPAPRPGRVRRARRGRRRHVVDARSAGGDDRRSRSASVRSAGSRCRPDGRCAGGTRIRTRWHVRRGVERRRIVRLTGVRIGDELERRGFDAGAPNLWRVPITPQRVVDIEDADVVVQFATGAYLDEWRNEPRAIEVATYEPRSAAQLAEFEQLRTELLDGLAELPIDADRLDTLGNTVDFNLFSVQTDPEVPIELQRTVDRMSKLGQETAVFLVPPDVYDEVTP